ncbi:MAG: hypothetical protein IJJ85_01860 [Clostridia bacterium]|nr:hypothetical protein [Clostridia bacterium]
MNRTIFFAEPPAAVFFSRCQTGKIRPTARDCAVFGIVVNEMAFCGDLSVDKERIRFAVFLLLLLKAGPCKEAVSVEHRGTRGVIIKADLFDFKG